MDLEGKGLALNVLVNEGERWQGEPLYQRIVQAAHDAGLAGATVLRGFLSFGPTGHFHDADIEATMTELPISILIVDSPEKVRSFLKPLHDMLGRSIVQTWPVNIELYRPSSQDKRE